MTALNALAVTIALLPLCGPTALGADIYLFGGQSNMVEGIVTGFVDQMLYLDPSQTLNTSRYRNPGTGLDSGWDGTYSWLGDPPGSGRLNFYPGLNSTDPNIGTAYSGMLGTWTTFLNSIAEPYEIKGIMWVQGEQDTKQTLSVNRYADSLNNLSTRIHEDLGLAAGSVEFYYSSMESTYSGYTYADELRHQQDIADKDSGDAASIANANLVDASGLSYQDTIGVHYDTASQTILGQRFADTVLPDAQPPEPPAVNLTGNLVESFEDSSGGSVTPPAGWTLVQTAGTATYVTSNAGFGSDGTGGNSGLAGQVSSTANPAPGNNGLPGAYLVNNASLSLDYSLSGTFDFQLVHEGTFDDIGFIMGDVANGITGTSPGELLYVRITEGAPNTLAGIIQDGTADGTSNALDTASGTIADDTWYHATVTWTPTSGTTGDLSFVVTDFTSDILTLSVTDFTFDSAYGQIGFGSINDTIRFDNVNFTSAIPEPASLVLAGLGLVVLTLRRRRSA